MCDCIKEIGEQLKSMNNNTKLQICMFWDGKPSRAMIATKKVESKLHGKPNNIVASYCPFCGEKYPDTK